MFTNTATGEKIQDKDYAYYYRSAQRAIKVAAAKAARLVVVDEDRGDVAEAIESIGEDVQDEEAFYAYIEAHHTFDVSEWVGNVTLDEVQEMTQDFEDAFAGTWRSEQEYTEGMIEEGVFGENEGSLSGYIDIESLTRDLFINDLFSVRIPGSGSVWVFYNH